MLKRIFEIDPWKISTRTLDKDNKRLQESLTSIGNGYFGMRGSFEEKYSGDTHEGTYIAGVWYPDRTRVGWWKIGYPDYFGKVINATKFIGIDITVNGHQVDSAVDNVRNFNLELNMKNAELTRSFTWEKDGVEVEFKFNRILSIIQEELALIQLEATVLKGSAQIAYGSYLYGDIENEDSNYEEKFWVEKDRNAEKFSYLTTQTIPNSFGAPQFTVTTMMVNISEGKEQTYLSQDMFVQEEISFNLVANEKASITKFVAVVSDRDIPEEKQVEAAKGILNIAIEKGPEQVKKEHDIAWEKRWDSADVVIEGDDEAQQGIRFNIFQLFATYYGHDARLNIGPKGFTGEKYGGATYWDTEAYIVPLYLSIAGPDVTKQLLKYRHEQLPGAIHNAKKQGLKGALYPMVTFTGVECHNEWEITFEEIHRNGAIAYAVYNYTIYTGDYTYLSECGIEVLLEISRFWADRVHYSKDKGMYMIHGVTGPNEYENNVNNNWYTNTMATWTLRYTIESLEKISSERVKSLNLAPDEIVKWKDIIEKMYFPKDEEKGIFVQHDTFLDKDLMPASDLSASDRPINQNWSWDKILRSCFIKQADVLQALYFLNDEYSIDEKRKNFEFYEPMTVHESSLSPCVHSILAAELGMEEKAIELYKRSARLDLDNYNNDTEDGLHITSMSGSWLSIVHGFAGMRTTNETLQFSPFCPGDWNGYSFKILYRGRLILVETTKECVTINLLEGESLTLKLFGELKELSSQISERFEK